MTSALRYEWVRTTTVRSTWVLIALAIILPAALTFLLGWATADFVASQSETGPGGPGSEGFAPFGLVSTTVLLLAALLVTLGAAAFGQEYRHGLIRVTLSVLPHRNAVFAAKLLMVIFITAVAAIVAILAIVLGYTLGLALGGASDPTTFSEGVLAQVRALFVVIYFVLIGFAVTALTRNQPLGILVPIVGWVVEQVVTVIALFQNWTWIEWVLPFTGALASVNSTGTEAWGHLGVAGLWLAVILIPAWVLFNRRDA